MVNGNEMSVYLNLLSGGNILYRFDERLNKILSINKNAEGSAMSPEQAYNELYAQATNMLLTLQLVFAFLKEDKPASKTNNGGKDV